MTLLSPLTYGAVELWDEWAEQHGIDTNRVQKMLINRRERTLAVCYEPVVWMDPYRGNWQRMPLLTDPPGTCTGDA